MYRQPSAPSSNPKLDALADEQEEQNVRLAAASALQFREAGRAPVCYDDSGGHLRRCQNKTKALRDRSSSALGLERDEAAAKSIKAQP